MSGRGGGRGGHAGAARPAPVIDLEKYVEKRMHVRFTGGREVVGTLKGFDGLVNVVLDDTTELLQAPGPASAAAAATGAAGPAAPATRYLGLVVCRGTNITVISPDEGLSEIANPFVQEEDEAPLA